MTSDQLSLVQWAAVSATGLFSLALLTTTVVMGLRVRAGRPLGSLGREEMLRIHRHLTGVALAGLTAHIALAVTDSYTGLTLMGALIPFTARQEPLAYGLGTLALWLVAVIAITSIGRRLLPVRLWRTVHLGAYGMWALSAVHAFLAPSTVGTLTLVVTGSCVVLVALVALDCLLLRPAPLLLAPARRGPSVRRIR